MNATLGVAALTTALLGLAMISTLSADEMATHDGTVISAEASKLVMSDKAGKEHSHAIGDSVKITVNGKMAKLEDLKRGMSIRVTTGKKGEVIEVSTIDTEKKLPA